MNTIMRKFSSRVFLPVTYLDQLIRPGIRILMYHRVVDLLDYDQLTVSPKVFDLQMQYLSENFYIISMDTAINTLFTDHENTNSIVITFDDGYLDNLENAVPILNKYNIPATIFITTEFCDQINRHPRYRNEEKRLHLDWDEVCEINEQDNISIGSHTLSHPHLSRIDNKLSEKEIIKSKEILEEKLNAKVKHFCYPSGDYGSREVEYIKGAGYETAVTVCPGKNRHTTSKYEMNRTEITEKDTQSDLFLKLNGSFDWMHKILHWKRTRDFYSQSFNNNVK